MVKYAVMINVDGDSMYVPENTHGFFNFPEPKLFDDKQDAELECKKWNTGVIIEYDDTRNDKRRKTTSNGEKTHEHT